MGVAIEEKVGRRFHDLDSLFAWLTKHKPKRGEPAYTKKRFGDDFFIGEWAYRNGLILPVGEIDLTKLSTLRRAKVTAVDGGGESCTIEQTGAAEEAVASGDTVRFWDRSAKAELADKPTSLDGTTLSWSGALGDLASGDWVYVPSSTEISIGDAANDRRLVILGGDLAINGGIIARSSDVPSILLLKLFSTLDISNAGTIYHMGFGAEFDRENDTLGMAASVGLYQDATHHHAAAWEITSLAPTGINGRVMVGSIAAPSPSGGFTEVGDGSGITGGSVWSDPRTTSDDYRYDRACLSGNTSNATRGWGGGTAGSSPPSLNGDVIGVCISVYPAGSPSKWVQAKLTSIDSLSLRGA